MSCENDSQIIPSLNLWTLTQFLVRTGLEGPGLTFFQKFGFFIMMVAQPYALARFQHYSTSDEIVHNQQVSSLPCWYFIVLNQDILMKKHPYFLV
mgnify:CR=1 FL=1